MSLSSITVSGTLKKDPEKRFTPTNIPVANLTLEVSFMPRGSQQSEGTSTQIVRVNAWRDLAEFSEKSLKAGDKVLVIGRAQINAYTTQDGKKKRELEIDATSVISLKDVMSIEVPQGTKGDSETFKKTDDIEQISSMEEAFTSNEEIPF